MGRSGRWVLLLGGLLATPLAGWGQGGSATTYDVSLGTSTVRVSVYEKPGSALTFFAPHNNEQIAIRLAKASVEQRGGRLVVVEATDTNGRPSRRINFVSDGQSLSVDPNRIFTANGRRCGGLQGNAAKDVERFAAGLIGLLFPNSSAAGPLVAVHNNGDLGSSASRSGDLNAVSFAAEAARGGDFHDQAAGVFLSNLEPDADNFVIVSKPTLVGYFAERGFNVVVQKPMAGLEDKRCSVDDGSMSVYAGQVSTLYICLEADAVSGESRQREMFDAVYNLVINEDVRSRLTTADKTSAKGLLKTRSAQ